MGKFKVGDRVRVTEKCKKEHDSTIRELTGYCGMVIDITDSGGYDTAVEFDTYRSDFHDLSGRCGGGHGYWLPNEILELEEESKEKIKKENVEEKTIKDLTKQLEKLTKKIETKNTFEAAMTEAIIQKGKEIAVEDIKNDLMAQMDIYARTKFGIIPKTIEIKKTDKKPKELKGLFHKEFETILKIVDKNVPLMLIGPAGSGKNHTLEQVAKALDLEFYFTNAVTQEYKLTGFVDANGVYHETEFYKAFVNGGLFFLDEIDASCAESLLVLNSAIANGYFDFPTGRKEAHKNFRVVAAGNTYSTGSDMVYVGRNVLDGATLDRFAVMKFEYDEDVERALSANDDLYEFISSLRNAIQESSLRYIVSMRATINATKLLEIGISKADILKDVIIKNMSEDDLNTILNKITYNGIWKKELEKMVD